MDYSHDEKKELTENLDEINGGGGTGQRTTVSYCPKCKKMTTFVLYSGGRGYCKVCSTEKDNF